MIKKNVRTLILCVIMSGAALFQAEASAPYCTGTQQVESCGADPTTCSQQYVMMLDGKYQCVIGPNGLCGSTVLCATKTGVQESISTLRNTLGK